MSESEHDFEDLRAYRLDPDDEARLLIEQHECTFIWANQEGWAVGVIMAYVWRDGCFWLTAAAGRARVRAVVRDPRVSVCVSSMGTPLGELKTVTYKGLCTVLDDADTKAWYYPALAAALIPGDETFQAGFARFLDSPDRVVLRVDPGQRIDYDGVKMVNATAAWIAEERSHAK